MRYVGADTVAYRHGDEVKIVEPTDELREFMKCGELVIVPVDDEDSLDSPSIMFVMAHELDDE